MCQDRHLDVPIEPIVYALKESVSSCPGEPAVVGLVPWLKRGDKTTFCIEEKKGSRRENDGTLADATHSLFRRVIAVIAGHARRSWILARCLHALGDLLEPILPHLNPLRHVADCSVFCEEEESKGMRKRVIVVSMPRHDCHCKTANGRVARFTGPHFHPSRISVMLALPALV